MHVRGISGPVNIFYNIFQTYFGTRDTVSDHYLLKWPSPNIDLYVHFSNIPGIKKKSRPSGVLLYPETNLSLEIHKIYDHCGVKGCTVNFTMSVLESVFGARGHIHKL